MRTKKKQEKKQSDQSGMTMVEALTAMAMLMIAMAAFYSSVTVANRLSQASSAPLLLIRSNLVSILSQDAAWKATYFDPTNQSTGPTGGYFKKVNSTMTAKNFNLLNQSGQPVAEPLNHKGLDTTGVLCDLNKIGGSYYPSATCPIQVSLQWIPYACSPQAPNNTHCDIMDLKASKYPPSGSPPKQWPRLQLYISIAFKLYNPSDSTGKNPFSYDKYNAHLLRLTPQ